MRSSTVPASSGEATAARRSGSSRGCGCPAIALLALGQGLEHPNPEETGFLVDACALLGLERRAARVGATCGRPARGSRSLATGVDIVAISVLAVLSGGAFSHARLAFFLVPVAVAFRFRPAITARRSVVDDGGLRASRPSLHPASRRAGGGALHRHAGGVPRVGRRSPASSSRCCSHDAPSSVARLAEERSRLLADALEAEQRERKALAESLHDHAIQNLLSARHELEEAGEARPHPALDRADAALTETVGQLRDAVFDLHPYVLDEAGLEAALRSLAQQAATRAAASAPARPQLRRPPPPGAARSSRPRASSWPTSSSMPRRTERDVALAGIDGASSSSSSDDGRGFPPERLAERLADGHVGLASQRVRVEAAGGSMHVSSRPRAGTRVEIRLARP